MRSGRGRPSCACTDRRPICWPPWPTRRMAGVDPVPVQIVGIPGRYVSSEQSSIVQFINGGPAKPTFAPPRPHERGVAGRPTLENNVETLAHLALIARYGDSWFR